MGLKPGLALRRFSRKIIRAGVMAYLGVIAAGCTTVPLDTALHEDQVTKLLKDSGASLIFCNQKYRGLIEVAVEGLGIRFVLTDEPTPGEPPVAVANLEEIFASGPGDFKAIGTSTDGLASLLYTSGTTADPKGVMLAHSNLLGEVSAVYGRIDIGPEDAVLGVLPLFHVLSQMANLLLPLVRGARVVPS